MKTINGKLSDDHEEEEQSPFEIPVEGLRREAMEQISREKEIEREDDRILASEEPTLTEADGQKRDRAFYGRAPFAPISECFLILGNPKKLPDCLSKFGKAITRSLPTCSRRSPSFS